MRRIQSRRSSWAFIAIAGMVGACGGGEKTSPSPSTGYFVDGAVAGIGYRTPTQRGVTGPNGEFAYLPGEEVTFFIGAFEFAPAPAQAVVTPLTIAGTTNLEDRRVVNIAVLLLSLDEDDDPTNGLQIPAAAADVAPASTAIDFDVPADVFAASNAVQALVADAGGGDGTVKLATDAIAHLNENIILGTWQKVDEPEVLLVLFGDGRFVETESGGEPGNGVDVGTYAYHPTTGAISFTITFETNQDGGFGDGVGTTTTGAADLTAAGELILTGPHGSVTFARLPHGTGLEGTWRGDLGGNLAAVFVFFGDNQFVYAESPASSPSGERTTGGLQAGTYTYSTDTKAIHFDITFRGIPGVPGSDCGSGGICESDPNTFISYDATGLQLSPDGVVDPEFFRF